MCLERRALGGVRPLVWSQYGIPVKHGCILLTLTLSNELCMPGNLPHDSRGTSSALRSPCLWTSRFGAFHCLPMACIPLAQSKLLNAQHKEGLECSVSPDPLKLKELLEIWLQYYWDQGNLYRRTAGHNLCIPDKFLQMEGELANSSCLGAIHRGVLLFCALFGHLWKQNTGLD